MLSKGLAFEKRDPFSIFSVEKDDWLVTLHIKSKQKRSRCPVCRTYSKSIHSHYQRTLKDLPAFGNHVCLRLIVRRFYCHNRKCRRKVFTERFKEHFFPYKRISSRLEEKLLKVALLMGGNPGEKLCRTLHMERSSSSLIRLIHRQKVRPVEHAACVGIDDWASKKRHTYGSCIVDLNRHKMIDLLKDREAATVEKWFKKHPEITLVSRDRYLNYIKGISQGAPHALQVGDRWHLLKNLGDAMVKMLERNRQILKYQYPYRKPSYSSQINTEQIKRPSSSQNYLHRLWQMKQVKLLHQQGMGLKATAEALQMARVTVRKYLSLSEPPTKSGGRVRVNISIFDGYLQQRLLAVPNIQILQLYKEIKQKGYCGGRSQAYLHLHKYIDGRRRPDTRKGRCIFFVPSKIRMLLLKNFAELSIKEQKILRRLCKKSNQIAQAYSLSTQFRKMMENKKTDGLKAWIYEVLKCDIPELASFGKGLLNDFEATKNALALPWSNGQVEGQINKLKTIKRQMYGRASFTLLRKRLLLDST